MTSVKYALLLLFLGIHLVALQVQGAVSAGTMQDDEGDGMRGFESVAWLGLDWTGLDWARLVWAVLSSSDLVTD